MVIMMMLRNPNYERCRHRGRCGQAILRAATSAYDSDLLDETCQNNLPDVYIGMEADRNNLGEAHPANAAHDRHDAGVLNIGLQVAMDTFTGKNNAGKGVSTTRCGASSDSSPRRRRSRIALVAYMFLLFFYASILIAIPFRIDVVFSGASSDLAPILMVCFLFPLTRSVGHAVALKVLIHSALSVEFSR